jgi:hypothetical protein
MEPRIVVTDRWQDQRIGEVLGEHSPCCGQILLYSFVFSACGITILGTDLVSNVISWDQKDVNFTEDILKSGHHKVEHCWGSVTLVATDWSVHFGSTVGGGTHTVAR